MTAYPADLITTDAAWGVSFPARPTDQELIVTGVTYHATDIEVIRIGIGKGIGIVSPAPPIERQISGFVLQSSTEFDGSQTVFVVKPSGPRPSITDVVFEYSADGHKYEYRTEQSLELFVDEPAP